MHRKWRLPVGLVLLVFLLCPGIPAAEDLKAIRLIKPQMDSGRMLMHVLKERKSSRSFSPKKLPIRVLSNILWAAHGVNRPLTGGRTVPSARNWHAVDVYVASAEGLYLYDAKAHVLKPVLAQDIRALTGTQSYVREAPINLIYVADMSRMDSASLEDKVLYAAAETGFISQNVYLYCASEGLATIVRGSVDRVALAQAMKLRDDQKITLAQTVGYPRK